MLIHEKCCICTFEKLNKGVVLGFGVERWMRVNFSSCRKDENKKVMMQRQASPFDNRKNKTLRRKTQTQAFGNKKL